ncbi:MAG: glycogen-binding domain-containing protein [Spirochaetia bacterium]
MKTIKGHTTSTSRKPGLPHRGKIPLLHCLLFACMVAGAAGRLFAATPLTLDLALNGLKAAQPPQLVDDVLILSYSPDHSRNIRFVGARFETEDYAVLHSFSRNQYGVYVLDYEVPESSRVIRYRLVVDGLWVSDPTNPDSETDDQGNMISLFTIEKEPSRPILNPRREADGSVTFVFRGLPGRRVTIQGDFNNWDPFVNQLTETEPGMYRITLHLLPGGHWYRFFSDGRRLVDRYNSDTARDPDGLPVSYFEVFPPPPDP